jgi:hypothetical protein
MPSADTSIFAMIAGPWNTVFPDARFIPRAQVTPSFVLVEFAALDNYPSACLLQPELEAYLAKDLALGHLAKVHVS